MAMLLIPLLPLLSVIRCALIKQSSKGEINVNIFAFNAVQNISGVLLMLVMSGFNLKLHQTTIYFSLAYAVFYLVGMISDYKALSSGPLALTSVICSYAIVIPCFYGLIFLNESFGFVRIAGIIMLLVSMLLINKKEENKKTADKKWPFYVCVSFVCNGGMLVINKMHQTYFPDQYQNELVAFALAAAFIVFLVIMIANALKNRIENLEDREKTAVKPIYAFFAGLCVAAMQYVCLFVAARVDAMIMFPLDAIYGTLFSVLASWFMFKEKFTVLQIVGICIGVLSVILLNS